MTLAFCGQDSAFNVTWIQGCEYVPKLSTTSNTWINGSRSGIAGIFMYQSSAPALRMINGQGTQKRWRIDCETNTRLDRERGSHVPSARAGK
jgi:hypothetical protein